MFIYEYDNTPYFYGGSSSASSFDGFWAFILGFFASIWVLCIAIAILQLVGQWKTYQKAGLDGWEALVPGHNIFVKFKLAGIHTAFYFLLLVPIANIFVLFWLNIEFAKSFGRSIGFGIGLTILPVIFYPILGFGKSKYIGPQSGNNVNNTMNVNSEEKSTTNDSNQ